MVKVGIIVPGHRNEQVEGKTGIDSNSILHQEVWWLRKGERKPQKEELIGSFSKGGGDEHICSSRRKSG